MTDWKNDPLAPGDVIHLPDDAPDGLGGLWVMVISVDGYETTLSLPYCDSALTRPYVPLILTTRQRADRLAEYHRQRQAWPVEPVVLALVN